MLARCCDARRARRVAAVVELEHHVDERAALEVVEGEPFAEDVEDRQQTGRRRVRPALDLGLQPALVHSSSRRSRNATTSSSLEAKLR